MNKAEYLDELRACLQGRVDNAELNRQIEYYSTYIDNEINRGRSEQEILAELGSARLIAKTILQTYQLRDDPISRQYADNNYNQEETSEMDTTESFGDRIRRIIKIAIILIFVVLILGVIFKVVTVVIPVIIMILLITTIFRLFGNGGHGGRWR